MSSTRAQWVRTALLFGGSILVGLSLAEALLRLLPPRWLYFEMRNVVQQDFSEPGPDAALQYVPRAGAAGRFRNREFDTGVRINAQRLRSEREYSVVPPAGTKRIVAAGNSFVFGWGVEVGETAASLLERQFAPGVEVLNLGVSGYTANETLARLKHEGMSFHPDLVLFFVSQFPWVERFAYVFDGPRLYFADTVPTSGKMKAESWLRHHSALASFLYGFPSHLRTGPAATATPDPRGAPGSPEVAAGLQMIEDLQGLSREKGFRPVVVLVPETEDVEATRRGEPPPREADVLRAFCASRSLDFVDLTPALRDSWRQEGSSPYFSWDDHWNAQGHRVAAAVLADHLQSKGLLIEGTREP